MSVQSTDIARALFRAVSFVFSNRQLYREDKYYLIVQLVKYHVLYYQYFSLLDKHDITAANRVAADAYIAKKNVVAFYERTKDNNCSTALNEIFGHGNWTHCITDGTISYD